MRCLGSRHRDGGGARRPSHRQCTAQVRKALDFWQASCTPCMLHGCLNEGVAPYSALDSKRAPSKAKSWPMTALMCHRGVTVVEGDPLRLTLSADGRPPLSFAWRRNGRLLPQHSGATLEVPEAALPDAGRYACRVTNPW